MPGPANGYTSGPAFDPAHPARGGIEAEYNAEQQHIYRNLTNTTADRTVGLGWARD
jgi:hypothetical protein